MIEIDLVASFVSQQLVPKGHDRNNEKQQQLGNLFGNGLKMLENVRLGKMFCAHQVNDLAPRKRPVKVGIHVTAQWHV